VVAISDVHDSLGHDVDSAIQKWYNLNLIRREQ
jgi:hypothetical protein